jgi:O-antigen ligase
MSLAFSRGAAVGVAVLIAVMAWFRYITKTHLVLIGAGIAMLLVCMPDYANRIASLQGLWAIVSPESASQQEKPDYALKNRTVEVLAAARMFMDHPVTGVGPGMFNRHYQEYSRLVGREQASGGREAHNLFLGLGAETGLLGLLTFLSIIVVTLRDLLRTRKQLMQTDPSSALIATGFFLTILSYLVTGMALHFAFVRYFWLMMALAASATMVATNELRRQQEVGEPA